MYPGSLVDIHSKNKDGRDIVIARRCVFLYEIRGAKVSKYSVIRFSKKMGFEPIITPDCLTYSKPRPNDVVIDIEKPTKKWVCLGKSSREYGCLVRPIDDDVASLRQVTIRDEQIAVLLSTSSHAVSEKISIGKDKTMGWLRGVDDDGLVVEFDSPVGQHSYDGLFKTRHCSIIPPEHIFENIQEISNEDKPDDSEDS